MLGRTKPYKFIGFGVIDVTKLYEFIGFAAMEVTKPYEFYRGWGHGCHLDIRPLAVTVDGLHVAKPRGPKKSF